MSFTRYRIRQYWMDVDRDKDADVVGIISFVVCCCECNAASNGPIGLLARSINSLMCLICCGSDFL
jgi:hypothetical protein